MMPESKLVKSSSDALERCFAFLATYNTFARASLYIHVSVHLCEPSASFRLAPARLIRTHATIISRDDPPGPASTPRIMRSRSCVFTARCTREDLLYSYYFLYFLHHHFYHFSGSSSPSTGPWRLHFRFFFDSVS